MSSTLFPFNLSGQFGGMNRNYNRFAATFPNPFFDYASTQMPTSIYDVLRWAEYLWLTDGTYRMAMQRVVSYFLTAVELVDAGDQEKEKYEDFLNNKLRIIDVLRDIGEAYIAYGNAYVSIYVPFRRHLRCVKCGTERPISRAAYTLNEKRQFEGKCPNEKCPTRGRQTGLQRIDRRSVVEDELKVLLWSPHEMRLLHHPITGHEIYYWQMPQHLRGDIAKAAPFYIEHTPWELVEAAAVPGTNLFEFSQGYMHHVRDDTLPGVRWTGWGVPRIMSNFKTAWYLQVLKRYNEAIALDYIVPFRTITPAQGTAGNDALNTLNLQEWNQRIMNMVRQHRRDPTHISFLPFPINYQTLGGEAKALAPHELMDKAQDEFLNGMGVPAELYRGSLQIQAFGPALRMFERTWRSLVANLNNTLQWLVDQVADTMNWEHVKVRLQPVTLADDIERKQIQLQLQAGQQISRQTAWAPLGINFREEIKRMFEEEKWYQETSQRFQEELSQKQQMQQQVQQAVAAGQQGQQGQPPGAQGMPQQGGTQQVAQGQAQGQPQGQPAQQVAPAAAAQQLMASGQVTPEDMMATAEQIAYQLLGMPYEMRKSQLMQIKKSSEPLHAMVIQQMEKIRRNAQQQGGFQVMQQQLGGAAGQPMQ